MGKLPKQYERREPQIGELLCGLNGDSSALRLHTNTNPSMKPLAMDDTEQEVDDTNFTPRAYQDQLLEHALARNTIIYLPTGAGKTFIALMAMKRMSEVLSKPLSAGGKRSVFLVNTVVLAHQQQLCIQKATALKVTLYTGDMNTDCWRRDRWWEEFENSQVLVATCQIILDVIRHGFVSFEHINLIIFDECHHGRNEHPMHQMMHLYNKAPKAKRPLIIGLTGMLISGSVKPQNVIEELNSLESTFSAVIATVRSYQELNNVLVYSTHPHELLIRHQDGSGDAEDVIARIERIVQQLVVTIDRWPIDETHQKSNNYKLKGSNNTTTMSYLRSLMNDFVYQMKDLGLYGASIAILSVIVELEIKKRSCETARSRHLLRILITGAEHIRHIIVHEIYDDGEVDHDSSTIMSNSSPKIIVFLMFLRNYMRDHDVAAMKSLIFVHRRHSAKNVFHIVKNYALSDPTFAIRADFMVGNNSSVPESIESVLENKWNRDVVQKFRRNDLNMIVASSVLEEGIDLQMCNLVVSLDAPLSFRSYVQSKGRARMDTSTYAIMVPISAYSRMTYKLREYKEVDKIMKDYLIAKSIDRTLPLREDVEREFEHYNTPEFRTKSGALLVEMSAVQLLNRYCNTLPNDSFTLATVNWSKHVVAGERGSPVGIVIKIRLPMQSTIKDEIVGKPRGTLKAAKRSAAFEACVRLYQNNELNENLMPINAKRCMASVKANYFRHWEKFPNDNGREAGTKQNVRFYDIDYPAAITNCAPTAKATSYLYPIQMTPEFAAVDQQEDVHSLISSHRGWAIMTSKPLPQLAEMKFFYTFGRVAVHIDRRPIRIEGVQSMDLLRRFNSMLFRDLLQTVRTFLVNDFRNAENSFIIVPILDEVRIDWVTVEEYQKLAECQVSTDIDRSAMQIKPADYLHKVITPTYRSDLKERYVVTKVRQDLTPLSPFPTNNYSTYADYFMSRYNKRIFNTKQFLVEVRGLTRQLNRLTPGQRDDGSKTKAYRGPECLIPELCFNFTFPGDLWLKAILLPNVLHRMHYMLHAESLRVSLNRMLGIRPEHSVDPEPLMCGKNDFVKVAKPKTESGYVTELQLQPQNPQLDETVMADPWGDLDIDTAGSVPPVGTIANPWDNMEDIFEELEIQSPDVPSTKTGTHIDADNCISFPWPDSFEPQDISRNLESIYPVDLQYLESFMTEYDSMCNVFKTMNVADALDNPTEPVIDVNLQRIDLLHITPDTPTKGPLQRDLMAALTSVSSADVFDGERLEVLGDAYLKFSSSVFLLQRHPEWHEGFLTTCKGQMVSNRNLFYLGHELIAGKLKLSPFEPKVSWQPPMMCVSSDLKMILRENSIGPHLLSKLHATDDEFASGCLDSKHLNEFVTPFLGESSEPTPKTAMPMYNFIDQQRCADKTVADSVEAIFGACVSNIGIERSFNVLKFFGVFPDDVADYSTLLKHRYSQPRLRSNINQREIDGFLLNYQQLERNLGYTFNDRAFLLQALTHPSFPTNSVTGCYQQLEFLGDAVLDFMITAYIFERCPQMHQGNLTDLRSALVNNNTLACLCIRNQFHRYILSQNALLAEQIQAFASFQRAQQHKITEQVLLLIGDGDVTMGEHIDVPKTLGDVFEALIGAVFLDSGNDLAVTWSVIYRLMHAEIAQFMEDTPLQVVRRLYEHRTARPTFDKAFVADDVVMVTVRYTCNHQLMQAQGFGRNSSDAKNAAAKVALNMLMAHQQ